MGVREIKKKRQEDKLGSSGGEKKDFVRRHGTAKGERKKHRKENEQRKRGIGNDAQSLF